MGKDPAFLFYPGDWLGGTMTLNRHQKGCYIDLLVAQFNNGPLSLETIKTVLGQDQAAWTVLSSKFKQDSDGNFTNERLAAEIEKRQNFSNKQKERVNKRWGKDEKVYHGINPVYTTVIPINENENRNENINKDSSFGKSENLLWKDAKNSFLNSVDGWAYQFCSSKNITEQTLKKAMQSFITDIELQEDFKDIRALRSHFTNWFNKKMKDAQQQKERSDRNSGGNSAPPLKPGSQA